MMQAKITPTRHSRASAELAMMEESEAEEESDDEIVEDDNLVSSGVASDKFRLAEAEAHAGARRAGIEEIEIKG